MKTNILTFAGASILLGFVNSENIENHRYLQSATVIEEPLGNIVEVAEENGFNTLVAAVTEAGLTDALSDPNAMLTVFAPTDEAFAAVEGLDAILADTDVLTNLLLNHAVDGKVMSGDLSDGQVAVALGSEELNVMIADGKVMINNAMVTAADVPASNGVIHVIDAVLSFEEPLGNIVEVAEENGFNTLVAAVTEAGLTDALSDPNAMLTVFAPTDEAFAAVEGLDTILADTDVLANLLLNHVVDGKVMSGDLSDGQVAVALGTEELTVMISDGTVMINNAMVIAVDVQASNGVIHVIDAVLSFEEPLGNIVEVAEENGFTTLLAAATEADLVDTLSDPDATLTVFAPTDEAFEAVEGLDTILADTDVLTTLLLNHVVDGKVMAGDLIDGQVVDVLGGDKLNVKIDDKGVMINNAMVTLTDVPASNGVIHAIDAVFTFDTMEGEGTEKKDEDIEDKSEDTAEDEVTAESSASIRAFSLITVTAGVIIAI